MNLRKGGLLVAAASLACLACTEDRTFGPRDPIPGSGELGGPCATGHMGDTVDRAHALHLLRWGRQAAPACGGSLAVMGLEGRD
ncbi:hypothetical protein KBD49_13950, partial [Myxococcota bacterium]|nr:hypothetical protein [Myxococcota bacterium]